MQSPPVQRALISVSDKFGLAEFAKGLVAAGVEIYSTGGTRLFLESHDIEVRDVTAYTGFPEMMHGRLKTLHPKLYGGILCRYDHPDDMRALEEHAIKTFELVVVNLYPFEATVARPDVTVAEAIEQIDIGGPSLIRASAKNHQWVTVASSPHQYEEILSEIATSGCTSLPLRQRLAAQAFTHTAAYDRAISEYFTRQGEKADGFPDSINVVLTRSMELRYGENPHQRGAVYRTAHAKDVSLVSAKQLNGKELSYNNLLDLDSALQIVRTFTSPAAVVIKHNNPCGAAIADHLVEAARKALEGDPQSAFGGIIGFNRPVDQATAELLATPGLFIEAIVAPDYDVHALGILTTQPKWRQNVRIMQVGTITSPVAERSIRFIDGGALVQDADVLFDAGQQWQVVTAAKPTEELFRELRFAWEMVRHVKSNAITICKDQMLLGAGAGQMSRVDSVDIAIRKAGERVHGAVLASDAFFPFPDSIHKAAAAGVKAFIQPGGSVKDAEVIAACNEYQLPMIFTQRRHFKH